jgi:tRNA 2-selenouridine synthase
LPDEENGGNGIWFIFTAMVKEIETGDFLRTGMPLIDVRSPGEYEKGHIPGTYNIPLFTDNERAQVGTIYTHVSVEKALEAGLQFVHPKLEHFLNESMKVAPDRKVTVHCFRGGMRSRAFAQHLSDHGFSDVFILSGGYKAYRNHVLRFFETPFKLKIVGGYTGSGKTEIIDHLAGIGFQTIDLEGIARHKGSSFGALGQELQPTREQFENNLFDSFRKLDITRAIWLEDESHNIGGVNIPMNLFTQMCASPVFFVEIPREERAIKLVKEYSGFNRTELTEAIQRISRRLGGENTKSALGFFYQQDFYELALLILNYYDKAYLKALKLHDSGKIYRIRMETTNATENTNQILVTDGQLSGN